jgi:hypothetical protein
MPLYESEAAFATEPGSLAHGAAGVSEALTGLISMKGELDIRSHESSRRATSPS